MDNKQLIELARTFSLDCDTVENMNISSAAKEFAVKTLTEDLFMNLTRINNK